MSRQVATRIVRPVLSKTPTEAKKGVNALYRDFYREMDWTCRSHMLDIPIKVARERVKKEFLKNKDVTDIRIIDMLVVKGRMQLEEIHNMWGQSYNLYAYFNETDTQKRKVAKSSQSFLDKFYESSD